MVYEVRACEECDNECDKDGEHVFVFLISKSLV
jgi:hypothetical protein